MDDGLERRRCGQIGGPIIKNRTFFFFDYLGARNNLPNDIRSKVPTALERNGNFKILFTDLSFAAMKLLQKKS